MSWKEHDRLMREFGFKEMTPDRLRRLGIFGTTLIPGGFGGAARRGKADDRTPPAARGEDPETCPFTTMHSEFGEGNLVVIPPSLLGDLLARRFGRDSDLDDIAHLLYDRRNYTADELNEGALWACHDTAILGRRSASVCSSDESGVDPPRAQGEDRDLAARARI